MRSLKRRPAAASFSRRSVKSSRSLLIAWRISCLQFDQDRIALIPKPLFDEEPRFLELLDQLLGAEEMDECPCKAITRFILPIEGGPSSQSHEEPFRRSCRSLRVARCRGERNDEDAAGFQDRMCLPQETNPAAAWEDIAIRDIRQEQVVECLFRVGEVIYEVGHRELHRQVRRLGSTPGLSDHPKAPITGGYFHPLPGEEQGLPTGAARHVQELSIFLKISLDENLFRRIEPTVHACIIPNDRPAIPIVYRVPIDLSRGPDDQCKLFWE